MMHPDITELARELNRNNKDLQAEIARLKTENHELIITLQQPDQVGYWQRRSELAEEKLATLRAALEPFAKAAEQARKQGGDPAYGLRWDDFLRAQNYFTTDERALAGQKE